MYGLGLSEVSLLAEKTVFVQRGTYPLENRYVHINLGARLIMEHPKFSQLRYPVSSLVALYVLTGSDYVSQFNYVTKERFFKCFLENWSHICGNGEELVLFSQPGTYPEFDNVHRDTWLKLSLCVRPTCPCPRTIWHTWEESQWVRRMTCCAVTYL